MAFAWFENLGVEIGGRQSCMTDSDCVVADNGVECPGGINICGCGVGVASEHLADVNMARLAAADALCAQRTEECVATSLCSEEMRATCVDGTCLLR